MKFFQPTAESVKREIVEGLKDGSVVIDHPPDGEEISDDDAELLQLLELQDSGPTWAESWMGGRGFLIVLVILFGSGVSWYYANTRKWEARVEAARNAEIEKFAAARRVEAEKLDAERKAEAERRADALWAIAEGAATSVQALRVAPEDDRVAEINREWEKKLTKERRASLGDRIASVLLREPGLYGEGEKELSKLYTSNARIIIKETATLPPGLEGKWEGVAQSGGGRTLVDYYKRKAEDIARYQRLSDKWDVSVSGLTENPNRAVVVASRLTSEPDRTWKKQDYAYFILDYQVSDNRWKIHLYFGGLSGSEAAKKRLDNVERDQ